MMSEETWLNAKKALQLGFVDGILFAREKQPAEEEPEQEDSPEETEESEEEEDTDSEDDENEKKPQRDAASMMYTPSHTAASFMQKISACDKSVPIAQLDKRLALLK